MSFLKNRTVVGVICILLSLLICFGLTPLFNQSVSQKAEIVRVSRRFNLASLRRVLMKAPKVTGLPPS